MMSNRNYSKSDLYKISMKLNSTSNDDAKPRRLQSVFFNANSKESQSLLTIIVEHLRTIIYLLIVVALLHSLLIAFLLKIILSNI